MPVFVNGPIIGRLRKLAKRLHIKRLTAFFAQVEQYHYKCKKMEKRANYRPMPDFSISIGLGLTLWVPAYHDGLYISRNVIQLVSTSQQKGGE